MNNIWLAFITGLTTGGVSCLTVQGGLLASAIGTNTKEEKFTTHWQQISAFIAAKILSHTILGMVLGALGSMIFLSPKIMGLFQILAGLFMIATALRLLDIHPVFRYLVITPPRWAYKILRKTSISGSVFTPLVLGLFSILMPCGITQAMMAQAVAAGSAINGGLMMTAFVLGTSPLFFALGAGIAKLLEKKAFVYIAALVITVMGVMSVNGGMVSRGSLYTINNFYKIMKGEMPDEIGSLKNTSVKTADVKDGFQEASITVFDHGYASETKNLKVNIPVKLKLITDNVRSCSLAFTIPDYNISKILPSTGVTEVEFTPTKTGRLVYTCSMGMYSGEFTVN